ncbi:unnamed protein product [Symbiodinium necroappetens]|uniref:Uncharacterized protein n=1 Tax=Symbiodinium necroappetens TaxID=1628268 RepID=A0A812WWX9_9DINO|nr:unnamed protein product [Symbiodinium necroappetens]
MARTVLSCQTPSTVAQQLSELLQCFPAAAIGGIQWKTLLSKYEERYSTRLDIFGLGHTSPLAATTTLLWDVLAPATKVLRLVDTEDGDNPIVAVEDSEDGQQAILVSQLKPLLQRYWHSTFDEGSLGYLTEEGSAVKMKKMKHLLQALLRWRSQRLAWQSCGGRSGRNMDEALSQELELLPSKRHNDLLLRFAGPGPEALAEKPWAALGQVLPCAGEEEEVGDALSPEVSTVASTTSSAVQEELAALRAKNEKLRSRNSALEKSVRDQDSFPEAQLPENLFDNPYEPPPQVWHGGWSSASSPTASTVARSTFSGSDGTPMGSGCVTPVQLAPVGQAITLVPMGRKPRHRHQLEVQDVYPNPWAWDTLGSE